MTATNVAVAPTPKSALDSMDAFEAMRKRLREQKKDQKFLSWEDGDSAVVQITRREMVETKVGQSPLYTAIYLRGTLEGREGGPSDVGRPFRFWSSTIIENRFTEYDVRVGDVVFIDCLGTVEGRTFDYKDFIVEPVIQDRGAQSFPIEPVVDDE